MKKTKEQWWDVINKKCLPLFTKKHEDYGSSWRILRLPSLTDQIFIKAQRIRTIQDLKYQKVSDGIDGEYIGIINYCIMALMQITNPRPEIELQKEEAIKLYVESAEGVYDLLEAKNHDYGEAWRSMRETSFTDLILMKLHRIKSIEDHEGKTQVSEGVGAGYQDIINYSIFALIKGSE
jgi:hypothetical protein